MKIVCTDTVLALRCPRCGRSELKHLSLFSFSGRRDFKLYCSCGDVLAYLQTKDWRRFWLQIGCSLCEGTHIISLQRKDIWSDKVIALECEDTGVETGYIGPGDKVRKAFRHREPTLMELAQDLNFREYFDNPDVMEGVLDKLYRMSERDKIYCQCGNHDIEIEVYSDHVELRCNYCRLVVPIRARSKRDLDMVRKLRKIVLLAEDISDSNSSKQAGRGRTRGASKSRRFPSSHLTKRPE